MNMGDWEKKKKNLKKPDEHYVDLSSHKKYI